MVRKEDKNSVVAYFNVDDFQIEYNNIDSNIIIEEKEIYDKFIVDKYKTLFHLGFLLKKDWFSSSLAFLYLVSETVVYNISKQSDLELSKENIEVILSESQINYLLNCVPYTIGMEYINEIWLNNLSDNLLSVFKNEIKDYDGKVATYFAQHNSQINIVGRVFFHLVEVDDNEYPFAFMATYSTKPAKNNKAIHTPLKNALIEFKDDQKQLLSLLATVTKVADKSIFISKLMENGELFLPIKFTKEDAYTFLKESMIYEQAGILCRIPDWWKKNNNRVKVSVNVGEKPPTNVGLDSILQFSPYLVIDNEKLSVKQLKEFLSMAQGLIQYKGKWVEIDTEKLNQALIAYEKIKEMDSNITIAQAMKLHLNLENDLEKITKDLDFSVNNGQWLSNFRNMMMSPEKINDIKTTESFKANLRTYQNSGYQWLSMMSKMGLGACLADDMGLGKTVQIIALLDYARVNNHGHALLILPASLIGNWQNEIEKFAPSLNYQILHNSIKKINDDFKPDNDVFLYITTYAMVTKIETLKEYNWDYLILDEAQAIKNAGNKQSKQIKLLKSKMRIALTGTPIENKLGDLWSLFDFLNPGLLGTSKEFTNFSKSLKDDVTGYARLRKIVNPFMLRRLKTDKTIISDLPEKIEIKEYTSLTKKQVILYKNLVNDIAEKIEDSDGIQRKGIVLASIIKFKQICNHPDQYLGLDDFKLINSGKFEKLKEICETIYEKRERVIVFTQFKEMTQPISNLLESIFEKKGFVLHGSSTIKQRNQMVEDFNGENYIPYMVLSLKAGGVGLNLTSANHVIHFDRWWNPAVENQATDRAFRIGQSKNVMVHKFVTKGTIEEKIDDMISDKQKLAGDILATSGENWISDLNNDQLMDIFSLGGK